MLYRPGAGYDWVVVNGYTINIASNPNDRRGSITVDTLKKGEYTLGYFDYLVGTYNPTAPSKNILLVNPNPSSDAFRFEIQLRRFAFRFPERHVWAAGRGIDAHHMAQQGQRLFPEFIRKGAGAIRPPDSIGRP